MQRERPESRSGPGSGTDPVAGWAGPRPFVGRDDVLDTLLEIVGRSITESGQTVFLLGPRGSGRTATLTMLQELAYRRHTGLKAEVVDCAYSSGARTWAWAAFVPAIRNPETRPDAMALGVFPERVARPDLFESYHSSGDRNISSYSSAAADSILERLRATTESGDLRSLYSGLQRRLAEDVPVIYTLYIPRLIAVGPRLNGVSVDLNGPLASAAGWWVGR